MLLKEAAGQSNPLQARSASRVAVLRRLLTFGRPARRYLLLSVPCMALVAGCTGLLSVLTGPALKWLLTGATEGLELLGPVLAQLPRHQTLWIFPLTLVLVGAVKGLGYLGQFYFVGLYGQHVSLDLRRSVFERLGALSPIQLGRRQSGDLLSRLSSDVEAVEYAATTALAAYLRDGLQLLVLLLAAVWLDWRVALAALVLGPLVGIPVSRLTRAVMRRLREAQTRLGQLAGQTQEGLSGVRTLQAFNAQKADLQRFERQASGHAHAMARAGWARGAVPALMEILAVAAFAVPLAFALSNPPEEPERLVSLLVVLGFATQPLKELGRVSSFVLQAVTSGERLFELIDLAHPVPPPTHPRPLAKVERAIRFEDVHFHYAGRPALNGLSLELPMGQVTALVGPSGSGKSTVASMLLRFEQPTAGKILIDGRDISEFSPEQVRQQFALVTQEPLLFSDTVLENLRFGRPDASFAEVEAAARVALADGFIRALPKGYDTPLGERGLRLSGGQRQRMCLARALVSQAPILVLDEATSSLDAESEDEVQKALDTVLPGRTALIIAHRLRTVINAARILVLEHGKVVESGTHAELLETNGSYARLWKLQAAYSRSEHVEEVAS